VFCAEPFHLNSEGKEKRARCGEDEGG